MAYRSTGDTLLPGLWEPSGRPVIPPDRGLQVRIALTLAFVFLLPIGFVYAFVAAMNHLLLPTMTALGWGPYHGRVYVHPLLVGGGVAGVLGIQAWFGPQTVLRSIGARRIDPGERPAIEAAIDRLARVADVRSPNLAIAETDAPNAAAVAGRGGPTIVLTTGLIDRVDDVELEAVLAHELAHITHRDATVMTVAWLLPAITWMIATGSARLLAAFVRGAGGGVRLRGGRGAGRGIAVVAVAVLVTAAIAAVFWAASVLVHRVLARYREFAADRGAVALTGDPAALASALHTLDDAMPAVPDADLRRLDGGSEALYVVPLERRAFGSDEIVSTDVFPATHPPTAARIDRLESLTEAVV